MRELYLDGGSNVDAVRLRKQKHSPYHHGIVISLKLNDGPIVVAFLVVLLLYCILPFFAIILWSLIARSGAGYISVWLRC